MNFVGQLTEVFSDETKAISADDKSKVNVGTLAVSRHFSVKNIFATNDQPNNPDHDFAYTNAKIVPAGYLLLSSRNRRSRSLSPRNMNQKKNAVPRQLRQSISLTGVIQRAKYLWLCWAENE